MAWRGGVGWGGFQVTTESNPTKLLLQLLWVELSWVELRWVLTINIQLAKVDLSLYSKNIITICLTLSICKKDKKCTNKNDKNCISCKELKTGYQFLTDFHYKIFLCPLFSIFYYFLNLQLLFLADTGRWGCCDWGLWQCAKVEVCVDGFPRFSRPSLSSLYLFLIQIGHRTFMVKLSGGVTKGMCFQSKKLK